MKQTLKISPVKILHWMVPLAFVAWLPLATMGLMGQRCAFALGGSMWQSDFWMPRITAELGYSASPSSEILELVKDKRTWSDPVLAVKLLDRCYPPMGMLPLKLLPLSQRGADLWTIAGPVLYLLLCTLAVGWRKGMFFAATAPFAFNFGQSNVIWIAAGLIAIFLAHYRSPTRSRQLLAAMALGLAASMKLSPAVLGLLYLPEMLTKGKSRNALACAALSAIVFIVFFILPFAAMPGGFSGIGQMFANAAENGRQYRAGAVFGLGAAYRSFLIITQGSWSANSSTMQVLQSIGQVLGFAAMIIGVIRRDRIVVVAAMLVAFPNQMFYTLLYLLPALALEFNRLDENTAANWIVSTLAFVFLCPLQLTAAGAAGKALSANPTLANLGLLATICLLLAHPVAHGSSIRGSVAVLIASKRKHRNP